jgi:alpha-D-xyloside xylohydrolase
MFDGNRHDGSRAVTRANGAYDFPLYLRAGSALPFNARSPEIWADDWKTDDLLRPQRQGWLVGAGRGLSSQSIASQGATLTALTSAAGATTLTIAHALREQPILVYPAAPACHVTAAGKPVPRLGLVSLKHAGSGWSVQGERLVIKAAASPRTLHVDVAPCAVSA